MKYVIEIDDVPMIDPKGNKVWRAKNFKTLVFDKRGLNKLEKLDKFEDNTDAKKRAEFESLRCGDVLLTDWDRYMVTGTHKIYDCDTFIPTEKSILEVVNSTGKKSTYDMNDYVKTCFRKLPIEELV